MQHDAHAAPGGSGQEDAQMNRKAAWAIIAIVAITAIATIAVVIEATVMPRVGANWQTIMDFVAPTAAQARDEGWTNIVEGL